MLHTKPGIAVCLESEANKDMDHAEGSTAALTFCDNVNKFPLGGVMYKDGIQRINDP